MFRLTSLALRGHPLILAYHGFEVLDEARFRPKLFITAGTFRRHLQILRDSGFNVVPLGRIVAGLARGDLPERSVAITVDDGFATTLSVAAPILSEFGFPATVYLTTYYMLKQDPVFDLSVGYLVWKGGPKKAIVSDLDADLRGAWNLGSPGECAALQNALLEFGRRARSEADRQRVCRNLAAAVGVDYDDIVRRAAFRLMSFEEARQLSRHGLEIGLHTHRHTFPVDSETECRREIEDNRRVIEREIGASPEHFCYPSGIFALHQADWLAGLGVRSATTCEPGFVGQGDSPFFLARFLDGEMVSDLEFEAELCGFSAAARKLAGRRPVLAEGR
jgi:peptidoglycan/xylan/chitin deacetylase (PgdA/CDA1 family)